MGRRSSVFGKADTNILAERGNPDFTGVNYHTSAQSLPIPILWGTRRISPQIIWQSTMSPTISALDKKTTIVENINGTRPGQLQTSPNTGPPWTSLDLVSVQGFWGALSLNGSASPDVQPSAIYGTHFWVPTILALCEGPISDPSTGSPSMRVWRGGGTVAAYWGTGSTGIDPPTERPDSQPFLEAILGTSSQARWSFWTSGPGTPAVTAHPGQDLAYRFTAYLASVFLNTGNNNVIPQWSFEITRVPTPTYGATDSYGLGTDYTPGGIIRDLLLSPQYGVGLLNADIDATSEIQYDTYTRANGIYLSPLLTAQSPVVDIIDRLAIESNSWIYWSGTAIMYAPLGDESATNVVNSVTYTFTPDLTPAYDLGFGDFLTPVVVDRADPIDCHNRLRLEFCDRNTDYAKNPIEWKDSTLINQYGILDASNIDAQDCCDIVVAAKIVELVGKRMAYIRNHYSFTLSMRYIRVLPGTIVTINDANLGLVSVPVRIISVDENEKGELAIVAEEYPGTLGLSRPVASQAWSQSNSGTGGTLTGGSPGGVAGGPPTSTSGGTLVMTTAMILVLYVAGDLITLPATMTVGVPYVYKHDRLRSPQPTPAILEENPVTFQRPGGATYNIEDPSDGTAVSNGSTTPPNSVKLRTSDANLAFVNTGDGLIRCILG